MLLELKGTDQVFQVQHRVWEEAVSVLGPKPVTWLLGPNFHTVLA